MTVFFSADHHIGNKGIIEHTARPYSSVEEMDEDLIYRWNQRVGKKDIVYYLGDFALCSMKHFVPILSRLKGRIFFVTGNHDGNQIKKLDRWEKVSPYMEVSINGQFIVLSHYAMRSWNKSHWGSLQLFGHSHGRIPASNQSLDVGVDCWDYYPVTLDEIKARMAISPPHFSDETNSVD